MGLRPSPKPILGVRATPAALLRWCLPESPHEKEAARRWQELALLCVALAPFCLLPPSQLLEAYWHQPASTKPLREDSGATVVLPALSEAMRLLPAPLLWHPDRRRHRWIGCVRIDKECSVCTCVCATDDFAFSDKVSGWCRARSLSFLPL